jgi:hypothetical protein
VKRTLEVLNELERQGVFSRYAIGGAMGAIFYTEPFLTFDLDVFLLHALPENEHDVRGRRWVDCIGRVVTRPSDREITSQCVVVEGVPVQFLPAYNSLVEEALNQAQDATYENVPTRVLRSEYLVAIALQTGCVAHPIDSFAPALSPSRVCPSISRLPSTLHRLYPTRRVQETVQSRQDVARARTLRDRSSEHYERTN